jgi:putative redox protein
MRVVDLRGVAEGALATSVSVGVHSIRLDEPLDLGGTDTGATPTEVLLAALGGCESITLRMYAARKGWPLTDVRIRLHGSTVDGAFVIRREVTLDGPLDPDQRARLLDIVNRCPVHRILNGEVRIVDEAVP